ncbi:hypothetical protein MKX03_010799 [Papaver bracteatum]|nr:hypothetical protein MKX03_010799 [Papaver bracteatum]
MYQWEKKQRDRKTSKTESNKLVETAADRKHHFFKIFQGETQNRVEFCYRLHTDSPACKLVVVQGPNGASWIVEVNRTQYVTYLEEGWELFVQENGLKMFDFLVFRHDGEMQFRVMVVQEKSVLLLFLLQFLRKKVMDHENFCLPFNPSSV